MRRTPGCGAGISNEHYVSEPEYMTAVADACRAEYKAIADAVTDRARYG
jgi:hypothetical protein